MIKKILLIGAMCLALTGCAGADNGDGKTDTGNNDSVRNNVSEKATGYEDGSVQRVYLYFDSSLYVFNDSLETITSDEFADKYKEYELAGKIDKIDNQNVPDENLEASRIEKGMSVYKKGDSVVIYDGEKYLYTMIKEK